MARWIQWITSSWNIGTDWSPIVIICWWFRWLRLSHIRPRWWVLPMYRSSSNLSKTYFHQLQFLFWQEFSFTIQILWLSDYQNSVENSANPFVNSLGVLKFYIELQWNPTGQHPRLKTTALPLDVDTSILNSNRNLQTSKAKSWKPSAGHQLIHKRCIKSERLSRG